MDKKDYYEVLGVNKNATDAEIKTAFRKLSRKYHPDMQAGKSESEKKNAEVKFKECAEAYEVLSNKDKRANYDQFGFNGPQMSQGNPFSGFDMGDFMSRHSSMFGDMFGDFGGMHFSFGGNEEPKNKEPDYNQPENGQNVQLAIDITFKEAIHGCEKSFDIKLTKQCNCCHGTGIESGFKPTTCNKCGGKGRVIQTTKHGCMISQTISDCPECNGSGYKIKTCKKCNGSKRLQDIKHITVKIPAGIDNGQRLRIVGKGHCGVKGGVDGNLYILVNIIPQNVFVRNGLNVTTKLNIDPITATLGGKVKVASPYEFFDIEIPSKTQSGKKIVINGKGIRTNSNIGNLIVEVNIAPFENLTSEQKKLLSDLNTKFTSLNFPLKEQYEQQAKKVI